MTECRNHGHAENSIPPKTPFMLQGVHEPGGITTVPFVRICGRVNIAFSIIFSYTTHKVKSSEEQTPAPNVRNTSCIVICIL